MSEPDNRSTSSTDPEDFKGSGFVIPGPPAADQPELDGFWTQHPPPALDNDELALEMRLQLSRKMRSLLEATLKDLTEEHQAEWVAKERLLDELLKGAPNAPIA